MDRGGLNGLGEMKCEHTDRNANHRDDNENAHHPICGIGHRSHFTTKLQPCVIGYFFGGFRKLIGLHLVGGSCRGLRFYPHGDGHAVIAIGFFLFVFIVVVEVDIVRHLLRVTDQ